MREGAQLVGITTPKTLATYTQLLANPRCNHVLADEAGRVLRARGGGLSMVGGSAESWFDPIPRNAATARPIANMDTHGKQEML